MRTVRGSALRSDPRLLAGMPPACGSVRNGFVWRHLPGPLALRVLLAVLLVAAVVAALFTWVFPALEPYMPGSDITVDQ